MHRNEMGNRFRPGKMSVNVKAMPSAPIVPRFNQAENHRSKAQSETKHINRISQASKDIKKVERRLGSVYSKM